MKFGDVLLILANVVVLGVILLAVTRCDKQEIQFIYGLDGSPGAKGDPGKPGADAVSCTFESTLEGLLITCPDSEAILIADGRDGQDGQDGQDGEDGQDGQDGQDGEDGQDGQDGEDGEDGENGVILTQINIGNSCSNIGSGYYAKKSGSDNVKIYDNATCSNSSEAELGASGVEVFWLNNLEVAILDNENGLSLKILTF